MLKAVLFCDDDGTCSDAEATSAEFFGTSATCSFLPVFFHLTAIPRLALTAGTGGCSSRLVVAVLVFGVVAVVSGVGVVVITRG